MPVLNEKTRYRLTGKALHLGGGAISSLMLATAWVFIIHPILGRVEAVAETSEALTRLEEQGQSLTATNGRLVTELGEAQQVTDAVLARIPEGPREADFLAQLSRLAQTSGLEIVDYRPRVLRTDQRFAWMEIQLLAEGSYPGICKMLAGLHETPRLNNVSDLQIVANKSDGRHAVTMTVRIYFEPPRDIAPRK